MKWKTDLFVKLLSYNSVTIQSIYTHIDSQPTSTYFAYFLKPTTMGLFWDLIQQSELDEQKGKADSLEERVALLETELSSTKALLLKTLRVLEERSGQDIDDDGEIG